VTFGEATHVCANPFSVDSKWTLYPTPSGLASTARGIFLPDLKRSIQRERSYFFSAPVAESMSLVGEKVPVVSFFLGRQWCRIRCESKNTRPSTYRLTVLTSPDSVFQVFWSSSAAMAFASGDHWGTRANREIGLMLGPPQRGTAEVVRCRFFAVGRCGRRMLRFEGVARRQVARAIPRCLQPLRGWLTFWGKFRWRRGACHRLLSGTPDSGCVRPVVVAMVQRRWIFARLGRCR